MIHDREKSNATLINIARNRPTSCAFFCSVAGNLPDRIEMKTILSIPRTSSRPVRVTKAIHV